jgi:hypothetical protein
MVHVDHSHGLISIETNRRQLKPKFPKIPSQEMTWENCLYFVASDEFVGSWEGELSLQQPGFCIHLEVVMQSCIRAPCLFPLFACLIIQRSTDRQGVDTNEPRVRFRVGGNFGNNCRVNLVSFGGVVGLSRPDGPSSSTIASSHAFQRKQLQLLASLIKLRIEMGVVISRRRMLNHIKRTNMFSAVVDWDRIAPRGIEYEKPDGPRIPRG